MYHHSVLTVLIFFLLLVPALQAQDARNFMAQNPGATWQYETILFTDDEELNRVIRTDSLLMRMSISDTTHYRISTDGAAEYTYAITPNNIQVSAPLRQFLNVIPLPIGIDVGDVPFSAEIFRFNTNTGDEWTIQEVRQPIPISDEIRDEFNIPSFIDSVDFVIRTGGKRLPAAIKETALGELPTEVFELVANVRLETQIVIIGNPITIFIELVEAYRIRNWLAEGIGIVGQYADPYEIDFEDLGSNFPNLSGAGPEEDDDEEPLRFIIPGFETSLRAFAEGAPLSSETASELPVSFEIEAIYPNPFNPTTTVRYRMEQPGLVSYRIYNSVGQIVLRSNPVMMPLGVHSFQVVADQLSSGVYILEIQANNQRAYRMITLMK